jgi:hypothetical protein
MLAKYFSLTWLVLGTENSFLWIISWAFYSEPLQVSFPVAGWQMNVMMQFLARSCLLGTSVPTLQWRIWIPLSTSLLRVSILCTKPSRHHRRPLLLVFLGLTIWMLCGTNYGTCQCNCNSIPIIAVGGDISHHRQTLPTHMSPILSLLFTMLLLNF